MKFSMRMLSALAVALLLAGGAAAQLVQMSGEVRDKDSKPFPDVTVIIKSDDFGTVNEVKTDGKGRFIMAGMRLGMYTLTFKNTQGQTILDNYRYRLSAQSEPIVVDFKEILAKEDAGRAAERKKQEAEQAKFEDMKTHFDAGKVAYDQSRALQSDLQKTPADQRAPIQEKIAQLNQTAITEYQAAEKAAPEKDPNLHKVLANLGQAYEAAGMFAESAEAYGKAITLRPTEAGYYMGWGTSLARTGKVDEAGQACDRAIPIDKVQGATCWRNIGIILYNSSKLKEAVGPLKRSTELEPSNPDTWYLLGASLVATMEYKKEGDKFVTVVQPGTAEAYQKYLELAPNGRFANDARAGLDMLTSLGAGIDTKVKTKGKK